ncbi:ABC transporter permease [Candidatus Woesearchaeota archaeon]|nr:ABC transporter permease [Candidatus Woesearchaeota archaeon]
MKFYRVNALILKYWYIASRRLDRVLDTFYWPLIGLLVWGFTTYYISDLVQNNKVVDFLLGGAILWTVFIIAQTDIGIYILEDFWSNNVFNLFASPVKNSELLASIAIFGLIRSAISFLFLILIAYLLYSFNLFKIGVLFLGIFASSLILFGWVVGIFVTGLIFRYGVRVQSFAWTIGWLIQPFSAVFYPLSTLPVWLQKISMLLPTTYIFEGMRNALSSYSIDWKSLIISFTINILLLILAYAFFDSSIKNAKKKGRLTRFLE